MRYTTQEQLKGFKKNLKTKDLKIKLDILMNQALIIVQSMSPYRSGDLSRSFKLNLIDGGFEISTDMSYMPYTNEKWISPQWRGRENPNEGWFQETTEYVVRYITVNLGGNYVSD